MTYSCSDFTDSIIEKLKIDIQEGWRDSPEAQAEICCAEIGVLQDFALGIRRALATVADDRNYNAFRRRVAELTEGLDALAGDTMIEAPETTWAEVQQ